MICIVGIILLAGAVCGADLEPNFANGRIVGGSNTDIKFHPYQVSVQRNGRHFCGGSIIHANYILTAAHCTGYSGTYSVRAGTSLNGRGGLEVGVAEVIVHEKYRRLLTDYDVALLRLARPLELSEAAQPVALAEEGEEFPAGTPAVATGWGALVEEGAAPLVLQEVELPLLDNAACKKYYPLRITARMICAGYAEGGRDACQGDSGGPLVVSGGRQVGIVSWGRGCARSASPGVYARVAALRDWIAQKSGV